MKGKGTEERITGRRKLQKSEKYVTAKTTERRKLGNGENYRTANNNMEKRTELWRPCNFTTIHSLTGPVGQPFASCLRGQRFA
jgi:hypothetical protein